jgi:hypothetical protein
MRAIMHRVAACAATAALLSCAAAAGELSPPGAPQPTPGPEPRTPIRSIPLTISQPGSYYFAADLTGSEGLHIEANDVTIDFCGFTLRGTGPGSSVGIQTEAIQNLTLRDGTVRDWSGDGLYMTGAYDVTIDNLHVTGCGATGMDLYNTVRIRDCVVDSNGGWGIQAGVGAVITGCTVRGNGSQAGGQGGINVGDGANVSGCSFYLNRGTSLKAGDNATLSQCNVLTTLATDAGNEGNGIVTGDGASLTGCAAQDCRRHGIETGDNCSMTNCVSQGNDRLGFVVGFTGTLLNCSARDCGGGGINMQGGTAVGCHADGCTYAGIYVNSSTTLENCVAENTVVDPDFSDSGDGFYSNQDCTFRGCLARNNGGSGFVLYGSQAFQCQAVQNDVDGFRLPGSGGYLDGDTALRNTGTDFEVNPGNTVIRCLGSTFFNGGTTDIPAPVHAGTATSPFANFLP